MVCRVIKKNEISQRNSESCSKPKPKMVGDDSSDHVSCQASYQYNPLPYEVPSAGKVAESFWISPDTILDSSKVPNLECKKSNVLPCNMVILLHTIMFCFSCMGMSDM